MSYIVKIKKGRKGAKGADGINGFGVEDIRHNVIDNPVFSDFQTNKKLNSTWTRTGDALITDRYGDFKFVGGGDITNSLLQSNTFSAWSDAFNRWTLTSSSVSDPVGGTDATRVTIDSTINSGDYVLETSATGLTSGSYYNASIYIRVQSGTVDSLEFIVGNNTFKAGVQPTSDWQRISVSTDAGSSSALFSVTPVCSSGTVIDIYKSQFVKGSVLVDAPETTTAPVTIANNLSPARQNQDGYLFEGANTNLIKNSENLTKSNWSISGGSVTQYNDSDLFNDYYKSIQIGFTNVSTILESDVSVTDNTEYTLSFFVKLVSGSVTSIIAQLADGQGVTLDQTNITNNFVRVSTKLTAGAGSKLKLTCVSPNQTGILLITGVQVETGDIGGYIRTGNSTQTKPADVVTATNSLPDPNGDFTLSLSLSGVSNDSFIKYAFSNDLSSNNDFSLHCLNDTLVLTCGSTNAIFTTVLDAQTIVITKNNTEVKLYKDGVIAETKTVSLSSGAIGNTAYFGANQNGTQNLNGFIKNMKLYDTELTANEIKYIGGV